MASLLLAEALCRGFDLSKTWASYIASRETVFATAASQAEVGFKREPHARLRWARRTILETNALGFRDKEFYVSKMPNVIRISFLGDSVSEGFGIKVRERFSNLIEDKLNHGHLGASFESYNFSVSGHATVDEYSILKNEVLRYKPDFLILQIGENDFDRNLWFKNLKKTDGKMTQPTTREEQAKQGFRAKEWLRNHSALYLAIAERLNYFALRNGFKSFWSPNRSKGLEIGPSEWVATEELLEEMVGICRRSKIKLMMTYFPRDIEVFSRDKESATILNERLAAVAKRLRVPFVDVLTPFRRDGRSNLYFDDCHLTPKGNRIVADIVADRIRMHFSKI